MKKVISLFLGLTFVLLCFTSCNKQNESSASVSSEEPTASIAESSAETSQETSKSQLELPDTVWDKTLNVYGLQSSDYYKCELWSDERIAEPVNDASYERSRWLQDQYGITLDVHYVDSLGGTVAEVQKAIQGGLDIDFIADGLYSVAQASLSDYYYDLNEISQEYNTLSLDKPWWDQTIQRDLSIGNKMFFLTGDITVTDDESTWACVFNKKMLEQYNLESPYEMVRNGTWTLDNMYAMSKEVVLMHGSQMSMNPEDGDQWGVLCQTYDGLMFMMGCGQTMAAKDADDIPYLRVNEEANINAFNKVFDIMNDRSTVALESYLVEIFARGNALFMPRFITTLTCDTMMLDSDVSYGILPMPKYDQTQDEYTSSATVYWLTVLAIPVSNKANLECTLFALEAMAWYGYENLTPAYYDKVLKSQKVEDTESEEMLDLIFRNRTYDIATVYNWNNMIQIYTTMLGRGSNTLVSYYDGMADACQKALDDTLSVLNLR